MAQENMRWQNKSEYLENVSGHKITERQKEINEDVNMFVVATTVFPTGHSVKRTASETVHTGYDAFIYYKHLPVGEGTTKVETVPQQASPAKMDIVIPD